MKKIGILSVSIVILLGVIFYFNRGSHLDDLKAENIQEVSIASPTSYFTITNQEDIQKVLEALNSSDLHRDFFRSNKDGFTFMIELRFATGDVTQISILSDSVTINGKNYQSSQTYCDNITELFDLLAKTYPVNAS